MKKKYTKRYFKKGLVLFVLLGLGQTISLTAQSNYSNAIQLTYGSILWQDQVSITYERIFAQDANNQTGLKLTWGWYLSNNHDFEDLARVYTDFKGLAVVHTMGIFEVTGGGALGKYYLFRESINPRHRNGVTFWGSAGVRLQKNHVLFRAGVGNLEMLYLSIGGRF